MVVPHIFFVLHVVDPLGTNSPRYAARAASLANFAYACADNAAGSNDAGNYALIAATGNDHARMTVCKLAFLFWTSSLLP